ncbi:sensor histidine kinase [Hydrogenophaga sp. OTU3427]|uniref:sensor histidine kinase n=1 Tax=Hydrogenophaga sp. OTU3427 TaxID=3043856 RepID=UPI00313CA0E4
MRQDLFAAVAHDLKNELGWLESALERSLTEPPSAHVELQQMHQQCVRLRRRLVEFLTLYGHEKGSVQALAEACALKGFLQEVAAESGHGKTTVALAAAPAFWVLDERLVSLALGAALDNASKFARDEVRLGAQLRDGHLVLFVEDDGPGLGSGETPEGTGLGTEVARMVAAAHAGPGQQGDVRLFNRLEGGCRFELVLPP